MIEKRTPEVGDVFEIPFTEYIVTALCISQSPKRTILLRKYKYDFENDYTYDQLLYHYFNNDKFMSIGICKNEKCRANY